LLVLSANENGTNDGTSGSFHRKDGCQPKGNENGQEHLKEEIVAKMETNQERMDDKADGNLEKMEPG
jgi:hypothetical protein